jgi:hypothetical protein
MSTLFFDRTVILIGSFQDIWTYQPLLYYKVLAFSHPIFHKERKLKLKTPQINNVNISWQGQKTDFTSHSKCFDEPKMAFESHISLNHLLKVNYS